MARRDSNNRHIRLGLAVAAAAVLVGTHAIVAQRGQGPAGPQTAGAVPTPRFHYLGPQPAGRIAAAVGVPGDPTTYYLGAASGGVWKSTDGGNTFVPVFDDQPVMAIGALAVSSSDPNQVWAGTGEAWAIRDIDIAGDGVYKSVDAGKTWKHMGLDNTGRIGRVIVHPTNPNVVFVCALGRATGPQEERGVFKTSDGGATWKRVLFVNPDTGCSGLSVDVNDPNNLVAGTWQMVMHTWGEFSGMWPGYTGEPGSGLYMSHDGGDTWKEVTDPGLPKPPIGKIDVAFAPSNSKRVYALMQTAEQGSLWRSDDGGATWQNVSWARALIGRAGYYIRLAVNPQNPDDVLVLNSGFHRSSDGGKTFDESRTSSNGGQNIGGGGTCGDCHDVWMDPKDGRRFVLTDDGGARINSPTGSVSVRLPIGQMYHVATDNQVPYWIYTNRQDNGTMRGPNTIPEGPGNGVLPEDSSAVPSDAAMAGRAAGRGGRAGAAPGGRGAAGAGAAGAGAAGAPAAGRGATGAWQYAIGGCESGFTIPDPVDPNIVWASCYGNEVTRWDARVGRARSVSPWIHTLDSEPNKAKYRCHWTPPMAVDPFDGSVYYGCQVVFHTADSGQSWKVISPDLSTRNPAHIVSSGGIVGDNLGQFYGEVVFAISPSPIQRNLLWAGTNDGKLWYTKDASGATPTWVDVTKNITGLPTEGTFLEISPSSFDPAVCYVSVDAHLMDDRKPYLFKTADFGATWQKISGSLPTGHPLDYARSIAENPNRKGMLFAGTGHAFFYSMDDGATWTQFKNGLPPSPVTWITVQKRDHDVVVSTYGRGIFVLRDITVLEQTTQTTPPTTAKLYVPRPGIRQARTGQAEFTFWLPADPGHPITLEIADSTGRTVRQLDVSAHSGLNRAVWDLRYAAPRVVALRTTPPENPHIWEEPRFQGKDTRPVTHWGLSPAQTAGPIAAPGKYTVKLAVDGGVPPQPFEIVKDPAIPSSDADLVAGTAMQLRVTDDLDVAADTANHLEVVRHQLQDQLKANAAKPDVVKALTDFEAKCWAVESMLLTHSDMMSDDKYYPEQYHVYMNLIWFNGVIGFGAGDVSGGAEYRPTDASVQVLAEIEKDLASAKAGWDKFAATDLPAFNKAMAGKIPEIKP